LKKNLLPFGSVQTTVGVHAKLAVPLSFNSPQKQTWLPPLVSTGKLDKNKISINQLPTHEKDVDRVEKEDLVQNQESNLGDYESKQEAAATSHLRK